MRTVDTESKHFVHSEHFRAEEKRTALLGLSHVMAWTLHGSMLKTFETLWTTLRRCTQANLRRCGSSRKAGRLRHAQACLSLVASFLVGRKQRAI